MNDEEDEDESPSITIYLSILSLQPMSVVSANELDENVNQCAAAAALRRLALLILNLAWPLLTIVDGGGNTHVEFISHLDLSKDGAFFFFFLTEKKLINQRMNESMTGLLSSANC